MSSRSLVQCPDVGDQRGGSGAALAGQGHLTVVDEGVRVSLRERRHPLDVLRLVLDRGGVLLRGEERFHVQAVPETDLERRLVLLLGGLGVRDPGRVRTGDVRRLEQVESELEHPGALHDRAANWSVMYFRKSVSPTSSAFRTMTWNFTTPSRPLGSPTSMRST